MILLQYHMESVEGNPMTRALYAVVMPHSQQLGRLDQRLEARRKRKGHGQLVSDRADTHVQPLILDEAGFSTRDSRGSR